MLYSPIETSLKTRVGIDVMLGAVSTWDLATSHTDLYFRHTELAKLYADESYPYSSEGDFLRAIAERFAGSYIIPNRNSDRLIVRLAPENAKETMTQLLAIRALAGVRCEVPTR